MSSFWCVCVGGGETWGFMTSVSIIAISTTNLDESYSLANIPANKEMHSTYYIIIIVYMLHIKLYCTKSAIM